MAARTTTQNLEVLYASSETTNVRATAQFLEVAYIEGVNTNGVVTTQYAEVLLTNDSIKVVSASNTLAVDQAVSTAGSTRSASASSAISFTQDATATRVIPTQSVSSSITFTGTGVGGREGRNILVFTQSATGVAQQLGGSVTSTWTISQTATPQIVGNRTIAQTIPFTQTLVTGNVYTRDADNYLTLSSAFSNSDPEDADLFDEALHSFTSNYVILQGPWGAIAQTVLLPKPEFQDVENLVHQVELRYSEDGTRYTYIKTQDDRRLSYTFLLSRQKGLELQSFIDAYNGSEWKMTNWKGEVWRVKLLTNPVVFTNARRGTLCGPQVEVSFDLEGLRLQGA